MDLLIVTEKLVTTHKVVVTEIAVITSRVSEGLARCDGKARDNKTRKVYC